MQITNNTATSAASSGVSAGQNSSDTDKKFADLLATDDAAELLAKITTGGMRGLWSFQIEQLKKKVASQVMQEMNITPEQLAKMDMKTRMSVEEKIMKEVERRVQEMVKNNMEKQTGTSFQTGAAAVQPAQDTAEIFDLIA